MSLSDRGSGGCAGVRGQKKEEDDAGKSTILEEKVDPNYEPTADGDI